MNVKETSRARWIRRTRESVARALAEEGIPMSASALEDNLDITGYASGLGFFDRRSAREISAALRWLVAAELATVLPEEDRTAEDPAGRLYVITPKGRKWAQETNR